MICDRCDIITWATPPSSRQRCRRWTTRARRTRADMLPSSLGLLLCLVLGLAQAAPSLESRHSEAQKERSALRAQIRDLQGRIEGTESLRQDASLKLKASEGAIQDLGRRPDELGHRPARLRESQIGRANV